MSALASTTYRTADLSIAAYMCAQGATVRSVQGRAFFLDVPKPLDAIQMALDFIGSPEAEYDQLARLLKKVILEWDQYELVGQPGSWSIEGRMEIVAYLCWVGAAIGVRLVGFQRLRTRGRSYCIHFDADREWAEQTINDWPTSAANRFDESVKRLKRLSRSC